jgi:hypothetical protein
VKSLQPDGNVLVHATPARGRFVKHDGWENHAPYVSYTVVSDTEFRPHAILFVQTLKNGNTYVYYTDAYTDDVAAGVVNDSIFNYEVAGLPGGYFGEGFNAIFRSSVTYKFGPI